MHAKAAESLCAACLTKSEESATRTNRVLFRALTDGKSVGESPLREKPRAYAKMPAVPQEDKERL